MTDEQTPATPATDHRRGGTLRRVAAGVLGVVAVVSLFGATLAMTVDDNFLETEGFVALVGPLVDDPAVRATLSDRLSEQTLDALALEERVPARLAEIGPNMVLLSAPIVAATEQFVERAVETMIDSDEFATLWEESLRLTHTRAIALLEANEADLGNLVIGDSAVTVDVLGVVTAILRRVVVALGDLVGADIELPDPVANEDRRQAIGRLAIALGVELPPDYGMVTVMGLDELKSLQQGYRLIEGLGAALVLLAMLSGAGAILLAADRRRAVIWLGLGVAAIVVVSWIVVRVVAGGLVDDVTDPQSQQAARSIFGTLLGPYATAMWWLAGLGLVAALVAYLYGPRTRLRRLSDRVSAPAR